MHPSIVSSKCQRESFIAHPFIHSIQRDGNYFQRATDGRCQKSIINFPEDRRTRDCDV